MQTIELDYHSKARVWINHIPSIIYPFIDVITQELQTGLTQKYHIRKAAIEIIIPVGARSGYGLLGAEFIPNHSGNLFLEVCVSTESGSIFSESIAAQLDLVRIGLPSEYSQKEVTKILQTVV